MDLAGRSAVAELRAGAALALPPISAGATGTSTAPSKTATSRTTEATAGSAEAAAGSTAARPALSAKLSASGATRTAGPAHHHAEIRLRILRQTLAQAARDLEGVAAVLAIHRRRAGRRHLRRAHLVLQLRFKLIPAGLRAAHASHTLGGRRFL